MFHTPNADQLPGTTVFYRAEARGESEVGLDIYPEVWRAKSIPYHLRDRSWSSQVPPHVIPLPGDTMKEAIPSRCSRIRNRSLSGWAAVAPRGGVSARMITRSLQVGIRRWRAPLYNANHYLHASLWYVCTSVSSVCRHSGVPTSALPVLRRATIGSLAEEPT